jgi:hypothetical protein
MSASSNQLPLGGGFYQTHILLANIFIDEYLMTPDKSLVTGRELSRTIKAAESGALTPVSPRFISLKTSHATLPIFPSASAQSTPNSAEHSRGYSSGAETTRPKLPTE